MPCDRLKDPAPRMDMGQLLGYTIDVINKYHECAMRHNGLIDYTK